MSRLSLQTAHASEAAVSLVCAAIEPPFVLKVQMICRRSQSLSIGCVRLVIGALDPTLRQSHRMPHASASIILVQLQSLRKPYNVAKEGCVYCLAKIKSGCLMVACKGYGLKL